MSGVSRAGGVAEGTGSSGVDPIAGPAGASPRQKSYQMRTKKRLLAELEQASVALRSIEAVTDPSLTFLPLNDLLDAVLARTKDVVGGDVVAVLLFDKEGEGRQLQVRAAQGATHLAPVGSEVPIGRGIVGTAADWGRAVVVPDTKTFEGQPTPELDRGLASVMVAPLTVQGNNLGLIEVGSLRQRSFGPSDLRLLQVVADRCAASIERARLDEAARRNRLGAEHANLHLRILARGGTVMSKALESYDDAFQELADVVVPEFADWFAADDLDPSGRLRRVVARGRSRGVIIGRAFKDMRHPHPQEEHLIRLAMAERRPQVFARTTRLDPGSMDAALHTPATLGSWPEGVGSMMILPVRVQGAFWGALSFVTAPGRRGYRPSDLFTARELADRVGVAVERVVSWRASRQAGETAVLHAQRLQRLVEAALVVNAQLAEEEVVELLAQHAQRVLDSEVAMVADRRPTGWEIEKAWFGDEPAAGGRLDGAPETSDARLGSLKRVVLAAAALVGRSGGVVRRPDDWPRTPTGSGAVGMDALVAVGSGDPSGGGVSHLRRPPPSDHARPSSPPHSAQERGWLAAPITDSTGDVTKVVVAVGAPGSRFGVEDESVLTLLAQMASVAFQNASLYADVRSNEHRLETVVESSPLAIAELSPTGKARWWNRAAADLFGWGDGVELPRIPVRSGSELVLPGLLESARSGKPMVGVALPATGPDDEQLQLSVSASPLHDVGAAGASGHASHAERSGHVSVFGGQEATVTGLLLVAEDVTERQRMLEQFNQAERLSAMTRMAGAVAHDFNNLLTVILGCSDVIGRRLGDDDALGQDVAAIQRAGSRAAALTGQLVRIGQQTPIQPEVVDVDEVLSGMAGMLAGVLGEDVAFEMVTRSGAGRAPQPASHDNGTVASGAPAAARPRRRRAAPARILVDRSELERSILNLAINARDAMPDGGTFTVRTSRSSPRRLGGPSVVQLSFSDTGVGMDPETEAHCFEPFFTTKGRARGTGLGLATVHATVTQAGGDVVVDTAPDKGTRFTFSFPAFDGPEVQPAGEEVRVAGSLSAGAGGETVLVVDDEPEVLRLEVRELQRAGYDVLGSSNASEALHLLNRRGGAVDLVVTDVVMPGMNGIDLAAAIRRRYPHVRVLFVSGHLDEGLAEGPLPAEETLLTKPFRPDQFSARVRESLDRPYDAASGTPRKPAGLQGSKR